MAITATQQADILRYTAGILGVSAGGYMGTLAQYVMDQPDQSTATHNLALVLASCPAFKALGFAYSDAATNEQFVAGFLSNLLPASITAANVTAAQTWMLGLMTNGMSRAEAVVAAVEAVAAVADTDANWGAARAQLDNRTSVATTYTITANGSSTDLAALQATIATVTDDDATVTAANTSNSAATGSTYTLTVGVDSGTAFTGGSGNDTFNATATGTFNALDSINGGEGTDTLNVLDNTAAIATTNRTVTNVEIANLSSASTVTANTTNWTGLTTLTAIGSGGVNVTAAATTTINASNTGANAMAIIGGGGASSFETGGAAITIGQTAVANAFTSIAVTGGTTVAISDNVGAAVAISAATSGTGLTTVSIDGNTGNVDITAKGLTAISATDLVTNGIVVTNTDIDTAHALALTLDGIDSSSDAAATGAETIEFVDAEATSVAIAASGAASYDVTVTAAKATSVTIAADEALQIDDLVAGVATTVGISGDSAVTITADTLAAAAVITSTSTGGVTLTQALGTGQQFVGTDSSAADTIELGATTKAITTGAGDDTVLLSNGVTALGTGGSINAGDGTGDTLAFTTFANAVTASAGTTFEGTISNFENLKLVGANGAGGATIDLANLDGISNVEIAGNRTATMTISNLASGGTLSFSTSQTNAAVATINVTDAVTGTADVLNIAIAGAAAVKTDSITAANVETINFLTDDTATTITDISHVSTTLTAAAAKTITVAGDAGLTLTYTGTTLTSFDASAVTGGTVTWVAGALAASSTIVGSATDINAITFSAANTASTFVTYTGSEGADTVVGSNGLNNIVDLGNGTNSYTQTNAGNATVTGGTGIDTIIVGTGANTVHLGGGTTANTVTVGAAAGLNVIDGLSTGVDAIVLGGIQTAAGYYTSVTGMTAGDTIDFTAVTTSASSDGALGAAISLGGASSFANYLDAAAADTTAASTAAFIKWFQFGGNTYVVVDNSDNATFTDGTDSVIELVGLVTLTTSTVATDVLTLV